VPRRSLGRQLERELVRYARRRDPSRARVRRVAGDRDVVTRTFVVDPDWRRVEDGRAARLGPRETIHLRGSGHFTDLDPHTVAVGWRSSGRALGLALWAGAVGASWWLGGRGRGPLVSAREHLR
jgi:hypothetical protein